MRIPTSKFALTLLVTIVILVATILLTWFFERCGLNVQDQVRSVQSMKDYVGWNWFFIKLVAMVVVVSPVVEELIFRFPTRLVKHTIFAVVISILFVILHAVPKVMATHDLMYFVEINSATFPLFFMENLGTDPATAQAIYIIFACYSRIMRHFKMDTLGTDLVSSQGSGVS